MRRMVLMRLCPQVMESAPAAVEEPLQMVNNRPFDRPPLLLAQSSHLICLLWLLVMPNFDSFTSGDAAQWWDGGSGVRGAGWGNATGCEAHLLIDGIILMAKSPSCLWDKLGLMRTIMMRNMWMTVLTEMTMVMLQDKQGVQYMVTGDGSDIVQQHNGIAAVTATVTQQYVQVIWYFIFEV